MSDSNKLINLLDEAELFLRNRVNSEPLSLNEYDIEILKDIADICDKSARLLEKAIVPPCNVRDRLYAIYNNTVVKGIAKSLEIVIEENKISYIVGLQFFKGIIMWKSFSFGENLFPTREEAKAELEKRCNNA